MRAFCTHFLARKNYKPKLQAQKASKNIFEQKPAHKMLAKLTLQNIEYSHHSPSMHLRGKA